MAAHFTQPFFSKNIIQACLNLISKPGLSGKILRNMALRITIVVLISTIVSYLHLMSNLEIQTKHQLDKYITQRGQRESFIFQLSQDNITTLSKDILQELNRPIQKDLNVEFDRIYFPWDDGTIRCFPQDRPIEKFDTVQFPNSFIGKNIQLDSKHKQILLTSYKLVNNYGHAWNNNFINTYFITPNNSLVGYWKNTPWVLQAESDLNVNKEEYYYTADTQHNPAKRAVWTGLYYDATAKDWMVSALNPAYDNQDNLIGVAGQDIILSDLMKNTINDKLPGTYNFIFQKKGRLIVHPQYIEEIQESKGRLNIQELNNRGLSRIFNTIQEQEGESGVIEDKEGGRYLAFSHLKSTDWYFVTVYPKSLLSNFAIETVKFVLIGALLALILEIFLLFSVIKKEVAIPLDELIIVADNISTGNFDINIDTTRKDEIGRLANSFNVMSTQLNTLFSNLEDTKSELENRVTERTQELQKTLKDLQSTQAQMLQAEKMSALGEMVAGVAHEINNPVNFIHANIEYIETYIQELLELVTIYQEYYPETPKLLQKKIEEIDLEFITEDSSKIIKSMNIGTIRIREIVKSLRNFSRLDEAEYKKVDIHEGIDNTLLILQHRLKIIQNQSEIIINKQYGKMPLVECYAGEINQVFMNIVSNAIDALNTTAITDKSPTIDISTETIDKNWVRICIGDNGTGIKEEVRANIFNPFFTTKPVGKGTGLGLTVSYQIIVETHKGKIFCDSELGKGTKFIIEIPVHQLSN